jgi:hypothetical protein
MRAKEAAMRTEGDVWRYRTGLEISSDLTGFSVEAIDGGIGKVDESTNEAGASYLVIDTGPWIFGKKVILPAGVVDRLDYDTETLYVNRTKDEIKNAPEYDENAMGEVYRNELGGYYGEGGSGYRASRDEL